MGPSKTVGLIAVVLLIILVTGYALGEDGTRPARNSLPSSSARIPQLPAASDPPYRGVFCF